MTVADRRDGTEGSAVAAPVPRTHGARSLSRAVGALVLALALGAGVLAPPPTQVAARTALALASWLGWMLGTRALARHGRVWTAVALTLQVLASVVLGLEMTFTHVPQSTGIAGSLAQDRWQALHWRPVNRQGFRDREHTAEELASRRVIAVVGDSFTAGYGIADVDDRFSDRLAARVASGWTVVNLGSSGADTRAELGNLRSFGHHADVVVLGYFLNDIDGAASAAGLRGENRIPLPRRALRIAPLARRSYFAEYLFQRWSADAMRKPVERYFSAAYTDPRVLGRHRDELLRFVRYGSRHGSKVVVVAFPHLLDLAGSRPVIDWLRGVMADAGVPVLDVSPLVEPLPPRRRIVSTMDPHPSVATHHLVGDALYDTLVAIEPSIAGG